MRDDTGVAVPPETGGGGGVVMNISTPGMQTLTRGGFSEDAIENLDIILFDGSGRFVERHMAEIIATGLGGGRITQAYAPVSAMTNVSMVAVANARSYVNSAIGSQPTKTELQNAILILQGGSSNVVWNQTQNPPAALPMWGDTGVMASLPASGEALTVCMTRMHARIDIVMADAASGFGAVRLCNFYNIGYLYSSDTASLQPRLPSGMGLTANYTYTPSSTPFDRIEGELFVFEAPAVKETAYMASPYVLVQAMYDGTYYWYRINMTWDGSIAGTVKGGYMPILRNHRYVVRVNKVNGAGYTTPDAAAAAMGESNNLSITILTEDEDAGNIVYDGNYYLSVDRNEFTATKSGLMAEPYYEVTVRTNYQTTKENGWVVKASDPEIIPSGESSMTSFSGAALADGKIRFTVAPNTDSSDRTLTFTIGAGKLSQEIRIVQAGVAVNASVEATVIPEEIIFRSWNGVLMEDYKYQLMLDWTASDGKVLVESIPDTPPVGSPQMMFDPFVFSTAAGFDNLTYPKTYSGSKKLLTIGAPHPSRYYYTNPMRSTIRITAQGDNGAATYEIPVKHKNFYVYHSNPDYPLIAVESLMQNVGVSYNTDFTFKLDSDPKGIIGSYPTVEGKLDGNNPAKPWYNNPFDHSMGGGYGMNMKISTKRVADIGAGHSIVKFKITSKPFPEYEGEIVQDADVIVVPVGEMANSYIVKPGEFSVGIPIAQANRTEELGPDWIKLDKTITAHVEWSDVPGVVSFPINSVRYSSNTYEGPKEAYLIVKGVKEGNAVVSVKQDGVVKWSWHIWVTEDRDVIEIPAARGFRVWMDRNLGAKSSKYSSAKPHDTYGLRYQWGRKDPFPLEDYFYKGGGTTQTAFDNNMFVPGYVLNSLETTIETPYIVGFNGWTGSAGTESWLEIDSNFKRVKTVYDPCPPGWMVPTLTDQGEIDFTGASFTASTGVTTVSGLYWPYSGARSPGINSVPGLGNAWTPYGRYLSADADTSGGSPLRPPGFRVSQTDGVLFVEADINWQYSLRCMKE